MVEFFYRIDNEHFPYPETLDVRELMHLQDFQKYILAKNLGFLRSYVKLKVEQYLGRSCAERKIERPGIYLLREFQTIIDF